MATSSASSSPAASCRSESRSSRRSRRSARQRGPELRLVVKAQVERGVDAVRDAARKDERIEVIAEDLPTDEHLRLFASADVCLAPSRWEGLGLHLFEATALGLPIVTNDNPPMNEVVEDGRNGLLVPGKPSKQRPRSDIGSFDPDRRALTKAIESLRDPDLRDRLREGALARREELSWDRTVEALGALPGDRRVSDRTARARAVLPAVRSRRSSSRSRAPRTSRPSRRRGSTSRSSPSCRSRCARARSSSTSSAFTVSRSAGGPRSWSGTRLTASSTSRSGAPSRSGTTRTPSRPSRAARSLATPCATGSDSARSARLAHALVVGRDLEAHLRLSARGCSGSGYWVVGR